MINNSNIRTQEIKRLDIRWCDLPMDKGSSTQGGMRPCIIVGCQIGCDHSPVILVSPCTSKMSKRPLPTHVFLNKENYNMDVDGQCLFEQVIAISKTRVLGYIDHLNDLDSFKANKSLKISLELEKPNTEIEIQLNKLVEEIVDIEKFVSRLMKKGESLMLCQGELVERSELINKFIEICNKYSIKSYLLHDYKIFDRNLQQVVRSNSLRFA